ncbi:MAG: GNAT family N-acetyltransferase [Firmicutes bacterium]|nr:GNAT family N-acetyltransferase [Bacillota bacterium]
MDAWLNDWNTAGLGYWTVIERATDTIIGFGGIKRMVWWDREVLNLYYRFDPSVWGPGIAQEMASTAINMATSCWPQWPVIARVGPTNTPSMKLAERMRLRHNPGISTVEYQVYTLGW